MHLRFNLVVLFTTFQLLQLELVRAHVSSTATAYRTADDYLRGHNHYRRMIRTGQGTRQPRSSNLHNLVWNRTLENKARQMSRRCQFVHEEYGENMHAGTSLLLDPLKHWFDENKLFSFRPIAKASLNRYGHYTQMVWADTKSVGCWRNKCQWLKLPQSSPMKDAYFTVCKYFPV
ncbi:hypothetical protein FBUS_05381 [Fasciolopsis buskii]|uniref:SCP domain-containing protein n=1 Tax=Fasciolopsis buskii TaxID=27845 RepID=A0A8E0RX32_9TREM|nr:hypothetical protein FBUS_05381 [Fasciolopsis buski]